MHKHRKRTQDTQWADRRLRAEGLRKGDGLALIAYDRRFVVLDARATLNQFLLNGTPDQSSSGMSSALSCTTCKTGLSVEDFGHSVRWGVCSGWKGSNRQRFDSRSMERVALRQPVQSLLRLPHRYFRFSLPDRGAPVGAGRAYPRVRRPEDDALRPSGGPLAV